MGESAGHVGAGIGLRADGKRVDAATGLSGRSLGAALLDEGRQLAVVVLAGWRQGGWVADADTLASELVDVAAVVRLSTEVAASALFEAVPTGCAVFDGQVRTFPAGTSWCEDPALAVTRSAHHPAARPAMTSAAVTDAFRAALSAAWRGEHVAATFVDAVVESHAGQRRAVCRLADGSAAVLPSDVIALGIPVHACIRPGQAVQGVVVPKDASHPWLLPDTSSRMVVERLARDEAGGTVLRAVVASRRDESGKTAPEVWIHPSVRVGLRLPARLGHVPPGEILGAGDVVPVRVGETPLEPATLALDAAEEAVAVSVLPDGPQWIDPTLTWMDPTWEPMPLAPEDPVDLPEPLLQLLEAVPEGPTRSDAARMALFRQAANADLRKALVATETAREDCGREVIERRRQLLSHYMAS